MKFPNVKVNRKENLTYYWLRDQNIVLVDPGYREGDIHIYKYSKTIPAKNLRAFLEETLGNSELETSSAIKIHKIGEEITYEVLESIQSYQSASFSTVTDTSNLEEVQIKYKPSTGLLEHDQEF